MRAPESWPYASEAEWRLWRELLDQPVQEPLPHIATLKREADCEIARIVRCTQSRSGPSWCRRASGPGAACGAKCAIEFRDVLRCGDEGGYGRGARNARRREAA